MPGELVTKNRDPEENQTKNKKLKNNISDILFYP
jgi:hypothetical protein